MGRPGKPGGKAERDSLRTKMSAQGCSVDEIAEEFRVRWRFIPLAAYRYAAGLTQLQAAGRYNEVVSDASAHVDSSLISKLELWPGPGGKAPTAYNLTILAVVYNTLPYRLVGPSDVDKLPRKDQLVMRATNAQAPTHKDVATRAINRSPGEQLQEQGRESGRTIRAELVRSVELSPSDLVEPTDIDRLVLAAAEQSRNFATWTESSDVGSTAIEMYRGQLSDLARRFLHLPAGPIFPRLVRLRSSLLEHLSRHQPMRQARELYALAGMTCVVLAHASHVLGHGPSGMTHTQLARLCAEEADHVELHAWALGTQALLAEAANQPRDALRYLRAARDQLDRSRMPGTAAVRLASYEARLAARMGLQAQALAALRAAEDSRQHACPDGEIADLDGIGGILSFPDPKSEFFAAEAHLHLGQHNKAEQSACAAISGYMNGPPDQYSYGDVALARLDLAAARLAATDLDGVLEAIQPVLTLPAELRIEPLRAPLMSLATTLGERRYDGSHLANDVKAAIQSYDVSAREILGS